MAKDDGRRTWHEFDNYDQLGRKYGEAYLKELGMRYGMDPTDTRYQPEDRGSQENFDPDGLFEKEALRRANNDYDFRRSQEAARLYAGEEEYGFVDKKWSEMTDDEREQAGSRETHMANKEAKMIPSTRFANVPSSIGSLEDNFKANKFMVDTYKDEGLGDKDFIGYGNAEQRAAVKDYYVDLDRENLSPVGKEEEDVSTTPLSDKYAKKDAPLSKKAQEAQDFVGERIAAIKDGSFNESYRTIPTGLAPASSEALQEQMAEMRSGTQNIDVNEFAKQRDLRSNQLGQEFSQSMYNNSFM